MTKTPYRGKNAGTFIQNSCKMTRQEFEKQCSITYKPKLVKAEFTINGEKYEAAISPPSSESKEHAIDKLFEVYKKFNP